MFFIKANGCIHPSDLSHFHIQYFCLRLNNCQSVFRFSLSRYPIRVLSVLVNDRAVPLTHSPFTPSVCQCFVPPIVPATCGCLLPSVTHLCTYNLFCSHRRMPWIRRAECRNRTLRVLDWFKRLTDAAFWLPSNCQIFSKMIPHQTSNEPFTRLLIVLRLRSGRLHWRRSNVIKK